MKGRNLFLILGLLSFLSGCAVGPDYVRPAAEVPASYKEMEGWKMAQPKTISSAGLVGDFQRRLSE